MLERLSSETSTSGGESETETKALAVMPWVRPSWNALITVTPLAKHPRARRKRRGSKGWPLAMDFAPLQTKAREILRLCGRTFRLRQSEKQAGPATALRMTVSLFAGGALHHQID